MLVNTFTVHTMYRGRGPGNNISYFNRNSYHFAVYNHSRSRLSYSERMQTAGKGTNV